MVKYVLFNVFGSALDKIDSNIIDFHIIDSDRVSFDLLSLVFSLFV